MSALNVQFIRGAMCTVCGTGCIICGGGGGGQCGACAWQFVVHNRWTAKLCVCMHACKWGGAGGAVEAGGAGASPGHLHADRAHVPPPPTTSRRGTGKQGSREARSRPHGVASVASKNCKSGAVWGGGEDGRGRGGVGGAGGSSGHWQTGHIDISTCAVPPATAHCDCQTVSTEKAPEAEVITATQRCVHCKQERTAKRCCDRNRMAGSRVAIRVGPGCRAHRH